MPESDKLSHFLKYLIFIAFQANFLNENRMSADSLDLKSSRRVPDEMAVGHFSSVLTRIRHLRSKEMSAENEEHLYE